MSGQKKSKTFGGTSLPLEPIVHEGYEIKSLKHGNTGHILFRYPSKNHNWENCWTQNIEDAKNGVLKYQQYLKNKKKN